MAHRTPYLLGGKRLEGVQLPTALADIESCIDDPDLAPLGHHVTARRKEDDAAKDTGQVHIQKNDSSSIQSAGSLMLRRRGMEADELAEHLQRIILPPPDNTYSQGLVELDISRNRLDHLPDILSTLRHLKILNVSCNLLTSIPTSLYQLTQLEVLNLSQNLLETIPYEMSRRLPNLVTLWLAGNQIHSIHAPLRCWKKMRHLQLGSVFGGNQLRALPDQISEMPLLEELDVSHNQLRSLPHLALPRLLHLNVSDNHLDSLPKSIARCQRLRTLNVSKNQLMTLPADLVQLTHLELLDVSENLLCIIPGDILETMRTTTLLITGNPLMCPENAYAELLRQMKRHTVCWPKCCPKGIGCEEPVFSSFSSSSSSLSMMNQNENDDDDASIDRELFYHAKKLSGTPLPCSTDAAEKTITTTATNHLVHSLRELASRTILRHQIPVPLQYLSPHLAVDLEKSHHRLCAECKQPFVREWVTSVQVKSYKGHPAVVRRIRFCSTACWLLNQSQETGWLETTP